ncbi:hypothetical protein EIP91_001242 [Steccherinum ochraceum]|uniref:Uncharacterized protein n=1 Tax=Steccherinum ochraceum TaxID=92696 RepID=A0A4R0RV40_9APHY|nr:hypothetical protein EIP91_001242 [Steccherinum ochraceum]
MAMTTSATRASFVIYTDDSISSSSTEDIKTTLAASASRIVVATASDKENVDPLTGQHPSIEDQLAKKRKTNVLVAKLVVTSKAKAPQPDQKKRKVLTANTTSNTRSRGEKKERKALGSKKSRNTSASRVRGVKELPKVEEEEDVVEVAAPQVVEVSKPISQACADSRCYELTVLPLADVSEAYSPSSSIEEELIAAGEKLKAASISKQIPADLPEARAPSPAASIPDATTTFSAVAASSVENGADAAVNSAEILDFSTPERKRIYSAFTFSSPSPAGERYYAVTRATSNVDRFSDLAFTLERTL